MTLTLTARDHDLLETLTGRVRLFPMHLAAKVWWPEARNQATARRRLELLAKAGWIECHIIRTQTEFVPAELTEAVLNHVARYRLTVFAAIERLPVFSAMGPRQIKDVLRDCQRQSLVGSAPLYHGAKYWYLDAVGAERCGLAEQRIGPLSEPAKLRALALLRFCCLSDKPRHRLTPDDLARHFPSLYRPGLPSGYYFDPAGSGRLGLARIDAARRGRWDRVLQTGNRFAESLQTQPVPLIGRGSPMLAGPVQECIDDGHNRIRRDRLFSRLSHQFMVSLMRRCPIRPQIVSAASDLHVPRLAGDPPPRLRDSRHDKTLRLSVK